MAVQVLAGSLWSRGRLRAGGLRGAEAAGAVCMGRAMLGALGSCRTSSDACTSTVPDRLPFCTVRIAASVMRKVRMSR